jgi:hypothetical protein
VYVNRDKYSCVFMSVCVCTCSSINELTIFLSKLKLLGELVGA